MWTRCTLGHRHWGRYGAAGLLLVEEDQVLLQLRSSGVHHGGTWSVPGGALEPGERPVTAALREAAEEIGLNRRLVSTTGQHVSSCGGWRFTTITGTPTGPLTLQPNHETTRVAWVPVAEVGALPLHPGFRAGWAGGLLTCNESAGARRVALSRGA